MGCSNSDLRHVSVSIKFYLPNKITLQSFESKDIKSYYEILCHLRKNFVELRYQNFEFSLKDSEIRLYNNQTFHSAVMWAKTDVLELEIEYIPVAGKLSEERLSLIDFLPWVVKILDSASYICRIGLAITQNWIITIVDYDKRGKTAQSKFIYHDGRHVLMEGKTVQYETFAEKAHSKLTVIKTETEQNNPEILMEERGFPKSIYLLAAAAENPQTQIYFLDELSQEGYEKIIYNVELPQSAKGSLIIDANSFKAIGLHLSSKNGKGVGLLFRDIKREVHSKSFKYTESAISEVGRENSDEDYDKIGVTSQVTDNLDTDRNPNLLRASLPTIQNEPLCQTISSENSLGFNPQDINTIKIELDRKSPKSSGKKGAIFSRSAILATESFLYIYDPLTNQKAVCQLFNVSLQPGFSLCTTLSLVLLTGLDQAGRSQAVMINSQMLMVTLPASEKRHRDHGSVVIGNKCLVISGMLTKSCESYSFGTEMWSCETKLPVRLKLFATASSFDCVYLSGGIKAITHKPSKTIWWYRNSEWTSLSLKLKIQVNSHIMFEIGDDDFIIFGGVNNKTAYKINFETNKTERLFETTKKNTTEPVQASKCINDKFYLFTKSDRILAIDTKTWNYEIMKLSLDKYNTLF